MTDLATEDAARRQRVLTAAKQWSSQLIDLGGQNRLLFYRDLKRGTLDLTPARVLVESAALDQLLTTGKVRLSRLFPESAELPSSAGRCRALYAKAQENFEERGIETLHLAWGMATWDNTKRGASIPAAPVVLWPLLLTPKTIGAEDFDLALNGEPLLNPVLLHLLREDYGVALEGGDLLALGFGENGLTDVRPIFNRLSTST